MLGRPWSITWISLLLILVFVIASNAAQSQSTKELDAFTARLSKLHAAGKFQEALPIARRAVQVAEKTSGPQSLPTAIALSNLAITLYSSGQIAESEPPAQRAVTIYRALAPDHPLADNMVANLSAIYEALSNFAEAAALLESIAAPGKRQTMSGADYITRRKKVVYLLSRAAAQRYRENQHDQSEEFARRALADTLELTDVDRELELFVKGLLVQSLIAQKKEAEAERFADGLVGMLNAGVHFDDLAFADFLARTGEHFRKRGRGVGFIMVQEAVGIFGRLNVDNDVGLAAALHSLAVHMRSLEKMDEAERLFKRALVVIEKTDGIENESYAYILSDFANLLVMSGRVAEATAFERRAIQIIEKQRGPNDIELARRLVSLALLLNDEEERSAALNRSLKIADSKLTSDDFLRAEIFMNLGQLAHKQGKSEIAIRNFESAVSIFKTSPHGQWYLSSALLTLARAHLNNGAISQAKPLLDESMRLQKYLYEDVYNAPDSTSYAALLSGSAEMLLDMDKPAEAFQLAQQSAAIYRKRFTSLSEESGSQGRARAGERDDMASLLGALFPHLAWRMSKVLPTDAAHITEQAFEAVQYANFSRAASALSQLGARHVAGGSKLASLIREQQDLMIEGRSLDRGLVIQASSEGRDLLAEQEARKRLDALQTKIAVIDKTLANEFPEYSSLANPKPITIAEAQQQLRPNEAMLVFATTPERGTKAGVTFIWAVTAREARWIQIEIAEEAIAEHVAALRCGLDSTLWEADENCRSKRQGEIITEMVGLVPVRVLPFDVKRAHELYKVLFQPFEDMIKDKHLFVVPAGPLTSIPLNVLVTEQPGITIPAKLIDYRNVAWLGTRQPISVLPSVASLKSLRKFARSSGAKKAYLGIGNPLLDGPDEERWGAHWKKLAQTARDKQKCPNTPEVGMALATTRPLAGFATLFRGAQADIEEIRRLTPLPETADELCAVGRRLGVPESEILLGANATEAKLKELSEQGRLADYAVLHFATHGALTGDVQGSAEPGLILTPPPKGTSDAGALARDDGFLTASEITTLKLNADWIVLSACNTAGPQRENAEALSGIARAFFYAGARALLVSHWAVGSDAAVKLTTAAFAELKANPDIGRADAFRRSMKELIQNGALAEAHPASWAPFVVVGEGSR